MEEPPRTWEIVPYTSFGPLVLNMTRAETRALLGEPEKSLARGPWARSPSDFYHRLGLRLDFDAHDRLSFVEAWAPCDPVYEGIHLLHPNLHTTVRELRRRGYQPTWLDHPGQAGPDFHDLGLAFYAPHPPRVEMVALFRQGYYDEPLPDVPIPYGLDR